MTLSGKEFEILHRWTLREFPRRVELEQFVREKMDINLNEVSDGDSLSSTVFRWIEWLESHGREQEFIALMQELSEPPV